jgi:hypothetical protein
LELSGHGFERRAQLRPQIERLRGDPGVELFKIRKIAIGGGRAFSASAVHVIAQEPSRPEQRRHRIHMGLQLAETGLRDILGQIVQTE